MQVNSTSKRCWMHVDKLCSFFLCNTQVMLISSRINIQTCKKILEPVIPMLCLIHILGINYKTVFYIRHYEKNSWNNSGANHNYVLFNFPTVLFTMALLFIANDSCVPCGMVLFLCRKGRKWLMRALRDGMGFVFCFYF